MNALLNHFEKRQHRQVLLVTGLSGAGKSSVMRALEDLGFYCVDNLPLPLISDFLKFSFHPQSDLLKVAFSIDSRTEKSHEHLIHEVERLKSIKDESYHFKVIFLNSNSETLLRRYQETRRKHPLASHESVADAIDEEKKMLLPLLKSADVVLDTDCFNIHQLRNRVRDLFLGDYKPEILVNVVSFGFKYGVPAESNFVCDLRFLPNPYFVPELKVLDGRSEQIQAYLFNFAEVEDYWHRLKDFINYSIRKYYEEGRFFVNVSIGCTGGKHRSVAFVEKLGKENWDNVKFLVHHRDVLKDGNK